MKSNIKKHRFKVCFLIFATLFFGKTFSQNNYTMYFSKMSEASKFNPAFQRDTKFFLSLPVISKFNFDIHTSGFAYNDIINQSPQYPDSLRIDFEGFLDKLKNHNTLSLNWNTDLFGLGLKIGRNFFSIGTELNIEAKLGFSKDLADFIIHGTDMNTKSAEIIDGKMLDATAYLTTYFGYARQINDRLTVGGKVKMYNGLANIHTNSSSVTLDFDGNQLSAYGDIDITASVVAGRVKQMKNILTEDTEFDFEQEEEISQMVNNALNNRGFGIDIGATYNITDKMQISASIIDFGKINWKTNSVQLKSNDPGKRFTFSGISTTYNTIDEDLENYGDDMLDSLQRAFDLTLDSVSSYTTSVPTKIFVGYDWEFVKYNHLQVLYNGRFIQSSYENSLSVFYSFQTKWLKFSLGNTIRQSFFNPSAMISLFNKFYVGASVCSSYYANKTSGANVFFGANINISNKKKKIQTTEQ